MHSQIYLIDFMSHGFKFGSYSVEFIHVADGRTRHNQNLLTGTSARNKQEAQYIYPEPHGAAKRMYT